MLHGEGCLQFCSYIRMLSYEIKHYKEFSKGFTSVSSLLTPHKIPLLLANDENPKRFDY